MIIKGQGHSLALVQSHSYSAFSNYFSLETACLIEAKFHVEPPWNGECKLVSNGLCHMTRLDAMPIYSKNLSNLLLWNQKTDDHETWYTASSIRVLSNDLFYSKVK